MQNKKPYGLYAIALAIFMVGALALGVPASTLAVLAIVLVCPLMMLLMMRGMHGHQDQGGSSRNVDRDRSDPLGESDRRHQRPEARRP
ncbi:DUF2933 domain-containing protein [Streptomyces sclerotialus]|uniref:DUF2933 domain-containing protein n=1 Tax=Streptomyces sclerotialus TaxID=1957 RepID=UPI000561CE3F